MGVLQNKIEIKKIIDGMGGGSLYNHHISFTAANSLYVYYVNCTILTTDSTPFNFSTFLNYLKNDSNGARIMATGECMTRGDNSYSYIKNIAYSSSSDALYIAMGGGLSNTIGSLGNTGSFKDIVLEV